MSWAFVWGCWCDTVFAVRLVQGSLELIHSDYLWEYEVDGEVELAAVVQPLQQLAANETERMLDLIDDNLRELWNFPTVFGCRTCSRRLKVLIRWFWHLSRLTWT